MVPEKSRQHRRKLRKTMTMVEIETAIAWFWGGRLRTAISDHHGHSPNIHAGNLYTYTAPYRETGGNMDANK